MKVQGNKLYASEGYVLFRRMTGENFDGVYGCKGRVFGLCRR